MLASNIPWSCTPEDIRALFEKFGTVVDVEVLFFLYLISFILQCWFLILSYRQSFLRVFFIWVFFVFGFRLLAFYV